MRTRSKTRVINTIKYLEKAEDECFITLKRKMPIYRRKLSLAKSHATKRNLLKELFKLMKKHTTLSSELSMLKKTHLYVSITI